MFLCQRMWSLVRICRDALGSRDINESMIPRGVRFFSHRINRLQLLRGVDEALISPFDIVIDPDAKNIAGLGIRDNLGGGTVVLQAVGSDAYVVRPILVRPSLVRRALAHSG